MTSKRIEDELYRLQLRWITAKDEAERKKAGEEILKLLEKTRTETTKD
jgi:hypothetical protein